jgi:hypothetical protein
MQNILGLAERSAVPMGRRTYGGSFQALRARLLSLGPSGTIA